jgi:hypothetical protein
MYPSRVEALARRLEAGATHGGIDLPGREARDRRRRALLGALLEHKAASGAFDVELLHYWLDSGLDRPCDRALFGLQPKRSSRA